MLTALVFLRPAGAIAGGIAGWFFADWRRVAALLVALGFIATWVIADHHRAAADAVVLQQRLDAQSKAFITAADAAMQAETARQASIAADLTQSFQQQQAARDAAEAKADAATETEIQSYEQKLAAGSACPITGADLEFLRPAARPQPAARGH